MAESPEVTALRESNESLVGYVQEYQQRLVQADFQTVQANGEANKLRNQLNTANERISQLEQEALASAPSEEPAAKAPAKSR
jgi:predicted nuclease with TOPRIM domain